MVKSAFRELVREMIQTRITSAFSAPESVEEEADAIEAEEAGGVVTTDEEREGFMIVRAIAREALPADRVFIRDQKSYCAVLVDNNNRKPLVRLWFNRSAKYIGLFDGEKEDRVMITSLDHIYDYSDRIRAAARKYVDG
ncbi:hypothetical protein LUX29_18250 [Aureimonas altamirensis]|uniref:hypothetical protein n=1 Tax=Aureimonas altamirensis TaxID=370622 RepID=UPI001E2AB01F|nr:hypothetical protein [Aureimonas altamirensis]UHD44944.1 hypothetical protein LUX29_18250 [Aureimonas altamirensis]